MQPHAKSIHLVIVDRFVPDLRRKTILWHFSSARDQSLVGCAGVGLPLALAARAALIEPARDIGFLPETNRSTARS
jgi:hypothetical protein